jgi:hypothetical protein
LVSFQTFFPVIHIKIQMLTKLYSVTAEQLCSVSYCPFDSDDILTEDEQLHSSLDWIHHSSGNPRDYRNYFRITRDDRTQLV